MKDKVSYDVIESDSLGRLTELIRELILEGWELQGGICAVHYVHNITHYDNYFQAVTYDQRES